jgi:hypothetical protein
MNTRFKLSLIASLQAEVCGNTAPNRTTIHIKTLPGSRGCSQRAPKHESPSPRDDRDQRPMVYVSQLVETVVGTPGTLSLAFPEIEHAAMQGRNAYYEADQSTRRMAGMVSRMEK